MVSRPARVRVLGAVIAGGRSRRFGSDKALAVIDGRPMIDQVIGALVPQVDAVVISGRGWRDTVVVADEGEGQLGPLYGLQAVLRFAARKGFDAVVSVPVDTLPLPPDLVERLAGYGPSAFDREWVIGYWPIECLAAIDEWIAAGGRSVASWLAHVGARRVVGPRGMVNINRKQDLVVLNAQPKSPLTNGHRQRRLSSEAVVRPLRRE
jgi:molybdopterin-guanine dinucleotide biosynthesis protein A